MIFAVIRQSKPFNKREIFCHSNSHNLFPKDNISTYLVPNITVERKVDMKVLVMIIVKHGIWLPRLPPVGFEVNARVVDEAVVIYIHHYYVKRH
jgi:hypothetical protein